MAKASRGRSATALVGAGFLAAAVLAFVVAVAPSRRPSAATALQGSRNGLDSREHLVRLEEAKGQRETKGPHCHTAMPGEPCYKDVAWAITDGIYAHPEWYQGLTNKSNFETFQAVVYKINSTLCPLPCNYAVPVEDQDTEKPKPKHLNEVDGGKKQKGIEWELKGKETGDKDVEGAGAACHTAKEGEDCFEAVRWAMTQGLTKKPEWYPKLDEFSGFESFQAHLHDTNASMCPKPCECQTSIFGDECHNHVLWTLKQGIDLHPEWYQGLTSASRFERIQVRLHEDANTTCPMPCTPRFFMTPSLFCFSVFQSTGYEPGLMKAQLQKREGIFSCDEFAVIADGDMSLGPGPYGEVRTLIIPHTYVGISKDNTAANTLIFIHAWQEIYNDFRFSHHDWTLKVDPDAVIVPSRLRQHLEPHTGKKAYIKNCNKYPNAPNWPMMFGSLEAISKSALWAYMKGSDRCKNELQWEAWGEDVYLAECLDMLGCEAVNDFQIISDKVCLGVDCNDGWAAAFHAFKSEESWFQCWGTVFGSSAGDGR